ncbi:hypothetical protein RSOL_273350 [Rhizoctonia solani AG-3 Rhs1AP]|uniref:Uncharacterized protein n=1 Tax=Rhizoctonia solani AG-3 Rhs1AP TaxID=1086054 RepID=A0A0A1UIS2_9AGAM|nr:hypothetical protein RSOL_273350 [Rhizoctonia solani AG-3 Rhs1AP]
MTSVQTAPGLPASMPSHRSRFIVSASSLQLLHSAPSSTPSVSSPSSTGSDPGPTSRRKRFSPVSVTHTHILGRAAHTTQVVSLGTVDLAAVLRHATTTRTPPELSRTRTPEPEEPEPTTASKDNREKPRYRVPASPVRPTKTLHTASLSRPPICLVRPRAQFPLYLPILDSRVPPIVLPSLASLDAAAAQMYITPSNSNSGTEGRRSGRARRPASRTLEYTSDPVPPVRKRRADVTLEKRELRTSKRARKDVNYVIPSLASIEREIAGVETTPAPRARRRRRSETSVTLSEQGTSAGNAHGDVEMKDKEDSPLSADDEVKARKARGGKPAN